MASHEARLAIARRLAELDPSDADDQHALAHAYRAVADVHELSKHKAAAADAYRRALAIMKQMAAASPDDAEYRDDVTDLEQALARVQG